MKILLGYPPLNTRKGIPLLSQNRQFQFFKEATHIFPVVPASAATLMKQAGYDVIWLDAIAQGLEYGEFFDFVGKENPDVIAFETKTPVIRQHWKIIDQLKAQNQKLKIILFGDHVTALPEESFQNSQVDFILTGGDYDFLLLNLCNVLKKLPVSRFPFPVPELEGGIYYRDNGQVMNSGRFKLNHDLNSLPFIDRELTDWQMYSVKNGNYKRTPGAYIMSGRDCWYHACTFCSWPTLYPEFRKRTVDNVLDEIGMLISRFNVREIMDDTGCFPVGPWLRDFCNGMIGRGFNKKIYFDCNMRFGALTGEDFGLMKKANFRLLLFGLESANQKTLDRVNKKVDIRQVVEDCKAATSAGLFPHITIMFGYPWESYDEALNTLKLGRWLLKKGYAYTMQATVVIPYPGVPLFEEARKNGWLKTTQWDDYDMKQTVMSTQIPEEKIMGLVQGMYNITFSPQFVLRKFFSIRDADDLKYYLRSARKVFGHLFDFRGKESGCKNEKCCRS